jgi:hypothetical protein
MIRLVRLVAIMTAAAITLTACDKSDSTSFSLNGRYMGTFSRSGMDTVGVSILFDENNFDGSSERVNYPAICHGSFDLNDNLIRFNDSCAWTANFDWSLILSGQYNISYNDGNVRIWKTNGAVTDEYLLRQVTR